MVPTIGHGDILFTTGTTKDAAEFKDTVQKLARHISTVSRWKQDTALGKAMIDLKAPVYDEPVRPVRKYYPKSDPTETVTDQMSEGLLNEPVQDNFDWSIETDGYK